VDFLKLYFKGWLFTLLSLGTYYPYFHTQRQAFLHSHTYFGNQRFHFTGHGSGLMVPFAVTLFTTYAVLCLCGLALALQLDKCRLTLLLIPFVLGPVWVWLLGQKQKYCWDHTTFGDAQIFMQHHLAAALHPCTSATCRTRCCSRWGGPGHG
jgi:uncharacterized membrane protein YjgN (DUF898 family)